ncbi:hypothetical protein L208DRAFT_1382251 [Tricholoma matsutake]|nr:hypothetical protein L208DRAFT_1382251 [Tricholoma matsutake 945]
MDWATAKNQPDFSEQDVWLAELTLWDTRDTRYADITMNIVEDIGMFETVMVSGVFKVPALAALLEDMGLYHTWERTLHAITRDTPAEDAPVEAEWRVQPEEAPVGIMANHHGERRVLGNQHNDLNGVDATVPFRGLNVILLGDFHQFPPVGNPRVALYYVQSKTE